MARQFPVRRPRVSFTRGPTRDRATITHMERCSGRLIAYGGRRHRSVPGMPSAAPRPYPVIGAVVLVTSEGTGLSARSVGKHEEQVNVGRLSGKSTIVTGSAVGVGREIAILYGKEGADVIVNYSKSQADAEETAAQVRATGARVQVVQADVSVEADARRLVQSAVESFGRLDVLVNNAAITRFVDFPDLDGLTEDVWDVLYDTNVKGTFWCCREAANVMRRQQPGGGSIINISSMSGIRAVGSSIAYCCSKASVIHLTKCLARALGPDHIRVNAIAPGGISDTRWQANRTTPAPPPSGDPAAGTPMGRISNPADVADVALWLAYGAPLTTGDTITVDGGRGLGG